MLCLTRQPRRETQSPSPVTLPLEISTAMEVRGGCVKQQNKAAEKKEDRQSGHLHVSPENTQFLAAHQIQFPPQAPKSQF